MWTSPPRQALPDPEPAVTIIILIIYRTLGGLLPARYQVDRRSLRYHPPHSPQCGQPACAGVDCKPARCCQPGRDQSSGHCCLPVG